MDSARELFEWLRSLKQADGSMRTPEQKLLKYDKEDVVNLRVLRERLAGCQAWPD